MKKKYWKLKIRYRLFKRVRITDAGHCRFHRDHRPTVHSHSGQNAIAHVTDDVAVVLSELLRMRRHRQRVGRVEVRAWRRTDVGQLKPGPLSGTRRRTCVKTCEGHAKRTAGGLTRILFLRYAFVDFQNDLLVTLIVAGPIFELLHDKLVEFDKSQRSRRPRYIVLSNTTWVISGILESLRRVCIIFLNSNDYIIFVVSTTITVEEF